MQNHPPGLIGVLGGELARYAIFYECLMNLMSNAPEGSEIAAWHTLWIADALNRFVAQMKPHHQWLQIWANDHEFPPDVLMRLLDHNVPLVAPSCPLRSPPNNPSIFHDLGDRYKSYTYEELEGKSGLLPVDAFGGPGMVIRREVIEKMGMPLFQNDPRDKVNPREDLYSISLMRQAGFQPYCDLDTWITHCTVLSVRQARTPDLKYGVSYYTSNYFIGSLFPEQLKRRQAEDWAEMTDPAYHVFID